MILMNKPYPLVSVIIVNHNGKSYLEQCLRVTLKATYANLDVIVVDNGSSDGSIGHVQSQFGSDRRLRVLENRENLGPALARNLGVKIARGKYLAFLDNDTEPEPTWLEEPIEMMESDNTIGICQCKLLLMNERNRFDYAGDYFSSLGFLIQRVSDGEIDKGQVDSHDEIFSAKSAALVMQHDVFVEVGGFDKDYFIYLEETDLAWRTWLKGYRVVFAPKSRVYHAYSGSAKILLRKQNYLQGFHGTKNYIATLIKNLGTKNLVAILPLHIIAWLGMATWYCGKGYFDAAWYIIKGILYSVVNFFEILRKRGKVQKMRMVSDNDLMPRIMKKASSKYFYHKLARHERLGDAENWYTPKQGR